MHLKRAFASIAAVATALAGLAVGTAGASADDQAATQTITVTNAQDNTTYTAYQLAQFTDITAARGDNGTIESMELTTPPDANTALKTAIDKLNAEGATGWSAVEVGEPYVYDDEDGTQDNLGALVATLSDRQVRALAIQLATQIKDGTGPMEAAGSSSTPANGKVTIDVPEAGWYLVVDDSADGTARPAIVPSTVPGYTTFLRKDGSKLTLGWVVAKHESKPDVQKENDLAALGKHTVGIGDTIPYTITTKLAGASTENGADITYHAITDRPGTGLTVTAMPSTQDNKTDSLVVTVDGTVLDPAEYTFGQPDANGKIVAATAPLTVVGDSDDDGNGTATFGIDLTDYARNNPKLAGSTVTVTYYGTVNGQAVDHVTNLVGLDPTSPDDFIETDTVNLGRLEFTKVGVDTDAPGLAGAVFTVTGQDGTVLSFVDNGNGTYTYLAPDATATAPVKAVTTPAGDGKGAPAGHVTILGIPEGTYTFEETGVPGDYSTQFKPKFAVTVAGTADGIPAASVTDRGVYGLANNVDGDIQVRNVKHVTQLPLTGAAGITLLVVAALLLGGAAALIALRTRSLKRQLRA